MGRRANRCGTFDSMWGRGFSAEWVLLAAELELGGENH